MSRGHDVLTDDELCGIIGPIARKYGIETVYLFGSRARGDYRRDSDYDFLVRTSPECGVFQLSGFFGKLKSALDSEIDVVSERSMCEDFRSEISKDLRLIYES